MSKGAQVAGLDIAEDRLDLLRRELGDRFLPTPTDVTNESSVEDAVAAVSRAFSSLDVAFNIAGASKIGAIVYLDEESWNFTVDITQKGVFFSIKHEARQMISQGSGGGIVNVSSLNARVPMKLGAAYATARLARKC